MAAEPASVDVLMGDADEEVHRNASGMSVSPPAENDTTMTDSGATLMVDADAEVRRDAAEMVESPAAANDASMANSDTNSNNMPIADSNETVHQDTAHSTELPQEEDASAEDTSGEVLKRKLKEVLEQRAADPSLSMIHLEK